MNDVTSDEQLDRALRLADPAGLTPGSLPRLVADIGARTTRRRVSRRWRVGLLSTLGFLVVGGTAVAGVSYNDYLLSTAPYQGLDDGTVRSLTYISVVQTAITGADKNGGYDRTQTCHIYPEFKGISDQQLSEVSSYIGSNDLSHVSDDAMAAAEKTGAIGDQLGQQYSSNLSVEIAEALQPVLPGLHSFVTSTETTSGPLMSALASYCGPDIQGTK